MNANDLLLNQAFCISIESADAKCHPDLGDGRSGYEANGIYTFERNSQWYAVPERDIFGNWKYTIDFDRFLELQLIFNGDFKPISSLPEPLEQEV